MFINKIQSQKCVLVSITLCNASINTWLKMDLNAKSVTFLMVISLQNFKTMHILLVVTCFQRKKKKHFVEMKYFIQVLTDQNALYEG